MHITKIKTTSYLIYAIISIFICFMCCATMIIYPPHKSVAIKSLTDISELSETAPGNYVNLKVDKLFYTGLDSKNKKHTNGHYYYNISNNNCTLFLLSDESVRKISKESTPDTITDYSIQGKIISDELFNTKLRVNFSNQINWTNNELSKMTYPYLVSEINPNKELPLTIAVILIIIAICSLILSISNFVFYFRKKNFIQNKTNI